MGDRDEDYEVPERDDGRRRGFDEDDYKRVVTLRDLEIILDHELHWRPGKIGNIMQQAYYESFRCEKKKERTITVGTVTVA